MNIYGFNRHCGSGKGSNSDIVIHASSFCELSIICDAVLEVYPGEYTPGTGCYNAVRIAKELRGMMDPLDDNPIRMFSTNNEDQEQAVNMFSYLKKFLFRE